MIGETLCEVGEPFELLFPHIYLPLYRIIYIRTRVDREVRSFFVYLHSLLYSLLNYFHYFVGKEL